MMFKNFKNKGFTLIELLAVIIILGVLMIIAIPSVTKYIDDSRKSGYVSTAKELAGGARTLIHSGNLDLADKDTTYYIDSKCIDSSNGSKTPYGELTKAYVVVNYTDEGYDYYWTSVDDAGMGVKKITNLDILDVNSIENGLTESDIENNLGVDARHKYMIINKENECSLGTNEEASTRVNTEGNIDVIDYPVGKTNKTLSPGDIVKIENEEFYFLKYDGDDTLLMARYNLKVGSDYDSSTLIRTHTSSEPGYGLQSSECKGMDITHNSSISNCTVPYSNVDYWNGQLGEGKKYPDNYVYDNNSNLYQYIENYKSYLESHGVNIKEARVMKDDDHSNFNRNNTTHFNIIHETSYWYGVVYVDPRSYRPIAVVYRPKGYGISTCSLDNLFGIRPFIII